MALPFFCDFPMRWFHPCDVWFLPLKSFILSVIQLQCKLVQDISHDQSNHDYVQSHFVFDIETTAQFSAFERYFYLGVISK